MSVKYYCRLSRRVASAASGTPPLSTTLGSLGTDRQTNIYTNTQTDICTTNTQTKAYQDTQAIVTSNTNKYHWSCRYMSNRTLTSWVNGPSSQISHQSTFSKYFIKYLHCKCLIKVPSSANISPKYLHPQISHQRTFITNISSKYLHLQISHQSTFIHKYLIKVLSSWACNFQMQKHPISPMYPSVGGWVRLSEWEWLIVSDFGDSCRIWRTLLFMFSTVIINVIWATNRQKNTSCDEKVHWTNIVTFI